MPNTAERIIHIEKANPNFSEILRFINDLIILFTSSFARGVRAE
jgi:hypothetical protein